MVQASRKPSTITATDHPDWLHFLQAYRGMMDDLESVFSRAPVSLVEYELLWRIVRSPDGRTLLQDLNKVTLLTPSGVSRLLTRMQEAGLVRRENLDRDRRLTSVLITDEGRRIHREFNDLFQRAVNDGYTRYLNTDERNALDELFKTLLTRSGRTPE